MCGSGGAGVARIITIGLPEIVVIVTLLTLPICVAILATLISVGRYVRKVKQVNKNK